MHPQVVAFKYRFVGIRGHLPLQFIVHLLAETATNDVRGHFALSKARDVGLVCKIFAHLLFLLGHFFGLEGDDRNLAGVARIF